MLFIIKIRVSPAPDSTYKIYDALIGLELGIIKSGDTSMKWNGKANSYSVWDQDQTLESALKDSVNWYFQEIDKKAGKKQLYSYYKKISYGNYNLSGDISDYWMESSLRISPVEQVLLLKDFYTDNLVFNDKNIKAVKNALKLSENNGKILFGKTGTGTLDGKNVNGWFVGFVEKEDNVFIFAVNVQAKDNAGGKAAAETALAVLRDKNIY
ncbi:penicillin-binding transpeptidase domain-containing protein [Sebaldella sp. S0638]|uniref:penicillin-binding transpeptidase domain-containing protein n=1 Tax=Sebaldella sp. S0638 TaxID=2957809 RepID=UPI0020A18665|nr:penicillin-binding transpeptidase domain-containing protein [Sebaldella sp. S0638]MCP1224732.1 penicillin-binding transpeptidase domain-containing protein [Sebaldella sp. S0638]